jgi:hypothetical protein
MNRGIFSRLHSFIRAFRSFVGKHAQCVQSIHVFIRGVFPRKYFSWNNRLSCGDIHELHEIHVQIMFIHGAWLAYS